MTEEIQGCHILGMPPGGITELGVKDEGVEPYEKSHPVEFFHTLSLIHI